MAIETVNLIVLFLVLTAQDGTPLKSQSTAQESANAFTYYLKLNLGMPGLAVAVAWSTSAMSGRWQPEPNWLDRVGFLTGIFWVVLMVFQPWITSIFEGAWS
jgi:hypothetical protein